MDIKNIESFFLKKLTFSQIIFFLYSFYLKNNYTNMSLISLKKKTNCSFIDIIKIFYFPTNLKNYILSYPFQHQCQNLLLHLIKDSLNLNNFSSIFNFKLTKKEQNELIYFYNNKFNQNK